MSFLNYPIKNRKIRLGLLGCGRIAHKHLEAIENLKDHIELIACCDEKQDSLDKFCEKLNVQKFTSLKDMLQNVDLDLVTVATPNGKHPEHIEEIAASGKHVICEKPLAIDYERGLRTVNFCKAKKVKLFLVHQNRFNDTIQCLWQAKNLGRFGKIYMITSNVFWTRPQDYYDKDGAWHGTKDLDGGAFLTQASHYIDLMQWIADSEPVKVSANLKTLARNIETEDSGVAIIEWANKILGSINVTMLTYPKNLEGSVTILGKNGTVKIGGTAMNQIEHWEFADARPEDAAIKSASYETNSVYGNGHVRYYANVVAHLRGEEEAMLDGDEGLKSLKLLDSIYKSNLG